LTIPSTDAALAADVAEEDISVAVAEAALADEEDVVAVVVAAAAAAHEETNITRKKTASRGFCSRAVFA
jgi:vacuolar-type H+-ATPase subunit B/Vma2